MRSLGWLAVLALCGSAAAKEHRVLIDGMAFTPRVVQARAGDTIVWTNKDLFVHNVTASTGALRSGELQPGQSWSATVPAGPAITYTCTLHPTMKGRIEIRKNQKAYCPGGGCQSSTLFPSGSMTQPNLPYSESSVLSTTLQPSSRRAWSRAARSSTR